MPREGAIVNRILKKLNDLPECKAEKTHGGYYGKRGKPDITGCIRGRRFEIEAKQPGEEPTVLQTKELERWRAAGAFAMCAHSWEEVEEAFRQEGLI